MPQDPQTVSPIAPTMAEAVGFNDRRVTSDAREPKQGELVGKGHAKNSMADASTGTAVARSASLEANGSRNRVHPPTTMPNVPQAAATQANGRVIAPTAAVHYDKDYDPGVEQGFDDAPTIGDYPAGRQRLRGFTSKG